MFNTVVAEDRSPAEFLLLEGLDLLAAFRAIKSVEARKALVSLIADIRAAEEGGIDATYLVSPIPSSE